MKYMIFLFIVLNFYFCNNPTIIKKKEQSKILEIAILNAKNDGFLFSQHTKYKLEYLNWFDYLEKCCKFDLEHEWDIFYKYKLKKKYNYFWFVKIYNLSAEEYSNVTLEGPGFVLKTRVKNNPKLFYVFFIDPKTKKILVKYHDMNYKGYRY